MAQEEVLIPASRPHTKPTISRQVVKNIKQYSLDTLQLPFFDDFSSWHQSSIPNTQKWTDNSVFINNSYGITPPTMGVASFDIIDASGKIHSNASPYSFAADTLTSKPIVLLPTDKNIFLSFLYQPQGLGDKPERADSLVVQFFSPTEQTWISVWQALIVDSANYSTSPFYIREWSFFPSRLYKNIYHDTPTTNFFQVILPVDTSLFLDVGFRFRFINYASRAVEDIDGRQSNCDMWNLDVVYLNKNRHNADTSLTEIATQTPILQLLKEYRSMPWRHLKNSPTAQREQLVNSDGRTLTVSLKVNNLANNDNDFRLYFDINCVKGAGSSTSQRRYDAGAIASSAKTISTHQFNLPATDFLNMPLTNTDSVKFELTSILDEYRIDPQLGNHLRTNDTCVLHQDFFTYYSYDDGTAENGYGVYGNYSNMSKVALSYYAYQKDTLSGIYIYFNHVQDTSNIHSFRLMVWSDRNGMPDTELYVSENERPRIDGLNQFIFYKLKHPIVVEGTFYIGWGQQSTEMLNIGFDVNSQPTGKLQVSLNGNTWSISKFDGQGTLMLRPSFAKETFDPITSIDPIENKKQNLLLYPNPTKGDLYLQLPENLQVKPLKVEIFTVQGLLIWQGSYSTGAAINLRTLPMGNYFLRLTDQHTIVGYGRFIKH
ncbi:MAG: T9SS type A sorting domain-containing protein [Bacteroidales bacterium]